MKMWPIRFVEGFKPGKKKKDDVGRKNVSEHEKRARYEQEKCPERTLNDKWCEEREWLEYDDQKKLMTCKICIEHCKQTTVPGNLKNKHLFIIERERLLDVISFSV
jgi:hypothetical protein